MAVNNGETHVKRRDMQTLHRDQFHFVGRNARQNHHVAYTQKKSSCRDY